MGQSLRTPKRTNRAKRVHLAPSRLEAMIEAATIDAYTESEQAGGFHAMIEQALDLPFETMVLGVPVIVKKVDVTEPMTLSRSATEGVNGRQSPFWSCRCRTRRWPGGSGSRRSAAGRGGADLVETEILDR